MAVTKMFWNTTNFSLSVTNCHLYHYAGNNPVRYIDPTGFSTEIDEETGEVLFVRHDKSCAILAFPIEKSSLTRLYGPPNYIGETLFPDSFESPETKYPVGIIYKNLSIDRIMNGLFEKAKNMGDIQVWLESAPGKSLDIKSQLKGHEGRAYHGFLYKGFYVTLREAGNILAGMNAAYHGLDYEDFQKGAGALQDHGMLGVFRYKCFGTTFGEPPYYGENYYQYRCSMIGYWHLNGICLPPRLAN